MIIIEQPLQIFNELFYLTNQRALYWQQQNALILSDIHVGKSAHFRKNGIAMPKDVLISDLHRLSALINYFSPKKIIIVGDLLHAGNNTEVDFFCRWKDEIADTEFHLVTGNHDKISAKDAEKLCLTSQERTLEFSDVIFSHDFVKKEEKFQINGHIHPGVRLSSAVKRIKLPAFACTSRQLILPAFSEFTGLDLKNTPKKGKFWLCTINNLHYLEK